MSASPVPKPPVIVSPVAESVAVQRRTLRLLFVTQTLGGIGIGIGVSVGALLATEMAGVASSGLAQSAAVVGGALLAVPATRITARHGRRPSLVWTYLMAAAGGVTVVAAAILDLVPLLFVGLFLFGGGSAAGLQARYTAIDLAPDARRGRHLSVIVWATTIGAVAGPNLAPLAGVAMVGQGVPTLAGPFVFSALAFGVSAMLLLLFLRPDPLILARVASVGASSSGVPAAARSVGMRAALAAVLADSAATLGITATAIGHVVMIGVMAMTPVHILDAGHDAAHTLRIVGIVLSFHIAGMFACAPLTGWLSDRYGRRPVILGGVGLLLLACVVAGTAGHDTARLAAGLTLLGLGWSGTMVAGSALLSESVDAEIRPSAQGLSDVTMGLAGASAGALSGLAMDGGGYPLVALLSALGTVPLVVMIVRRTRRAAASV
jgi:MFS family permease